MVNYQLGKIYKIVSAQTNKVYIGSTCKKYLSERMTKHKNDMKNHEKGTRCLLASYEILKNEDAQIVLVESFPCNSKDELTAREQYWINEYREVSTNIKNAKGLNIEKRKQRQRRLYQKYKAKNNTKDKQRYIKRKERLLEKIVCVCGSITSKISIRKHERTNKHQNYLKKIPEL
jgi:hypothetical protein